MPTPLVETKQVMHLTQLLPLPLSFSISHAGAERDNLLVLRWENLSGGPFYS